MFKIKLTMENHLNLFTLPSTGTPYYLQHDQLIFDEMTNLDHFIFFLFPFQSNV
ncbi:hypothetical protein [Neobacillus sp. OS1-33]|uniref:hypothetical protein n=1 Tax=Neobacillus sp. OS1-33 TaxID=3070683 RepID=UPI0027DEE6BE|nr:hypothetical protein [Neobacillus sp. OS1-33]WML24594.1 hypothetical protein RCG22_17095 [Neobacillus sp. OS1-33]